MTDASILAETFPNPSALSEVDAKGYVLDACRDTVLRKCRMKNDNRNCFECGARGPVWCSVTFGVYLCLDCSGNHRKKGVHISFVRSVDMDKFYPDQLVQMVIGGNGKALNYFKEAGMGRASTTGRAVDWQSKNALKYKSDLQKNAKAGAATLGAAERAADDLAAEENGEHGASNGATNGAGAEPAAPEVVWTVGQRIQFRDQGNPAWKWGHVTHCKPLKVDYAAHQEIRLTPSGKAYNAEQQRAIAFAAKPAAAASNGAAAAAAPKAAAAPAPASPVLAAQAAPKAAASNMVVRGVNGAAPAVRVAAGYTAPPVPAAQANKTVGKEIDFGDDCFGDIGDMLKKKVSPKTTPKTTPQSGPAPAPGSPEAKALPAPVKKVQEEVEFDFDF